MGWFKHHSKQQQTYAPPPGPPPIFDAPPGPPPSWAAADEPAREWGLLNEAPFDEYLAAEEFCRTHPVEAPRLLPSSDVDRIRSEGCKAWELEHPPASSRFRGRLETLGGRKADMAISKAVKVVTDTGCGDVCLLSNLPIMAGQYENRGKQGVYFEVQVLKMNGTIAIGTACRPYPTYRFPGWNRLSAGLHLDDFQKFFEDADGGRTYDDRLTSIRPGDVVGCGYEFATAELFFTHNGERLKTAFRGIYVPRHAYDVYAAIGVGGPGANEFIANFGGDQTERPLSWKAAREWGWSLEGSVGQIDGNEASGSELPSYAETYR